jgi:hypothetical protein
LQNKVPRDVSAFGRFLEGRVGLSSRTIRG